ncbi:hypothetical protein EAG_16275 [Camponotus floridanus]|uniref:Uncharacterized protein n=1 Tax=Camponotus floridanus TaxID=104421 RepID=E2AGA2_CAMFO|nr:hypothetical protein EAG_16275 [Camponotus floridanus]
MFIETIAFFVARRRLSTNAGRDFPDLSDETKCKLVKNGTDEKRNSNIGRQRNFPRLNVTVCELVLFAGGHHPLFGNRREVQNEKRESRIESPKLRGFGVLQSRDQPGQTLCTLRALTSDTDFAARVSRLAEARKKREDPGLPIRTVNYRGKQTFNFPRASTTKNQIRGILSQACQTWGADIKVGRDILYEHVGYRPRRRTPIDDKTARAVGHKLEGAFYPRHASTERRNDSGAKQTNV